MKKIIVGILALGFFIVAGQTASAAWNTYPSDCPYSLTIGNYTTSEGIMDGSNGCWTKKSISAKAGDAINVAVFYDNTNGTDANNVVVRLTQSPSGSMTSTNSTYTFSGSLDSSVGSLALSTVTANLTSSQTLTYGQYSYYKNGSDSKSTLPNGQSGYEAFDGTGLNLGTIPKGDWGEIQFSFGVGTNGNNNTCQNPSATNYGGPLPCNFYNPPVYNNCYINNFTANGSTDITVQSNDYVRLAWDTSNCTSVNISGPDGFYSTSPNDTRTIYPRNSGTYTLTAYGYNGGTQTRTVYIRVNDNQYNNCTISNFTGNGSTYPIIQSGNAVNFVWNTYGCTSVNVIGPGLNEYNLSGSRTIYPTISGTYTLTAYSNNNTYNYNSGTQTRTVYVNVTAPIIIPPVVVNNCAVTTVATNVGQNSATLNGLLTNSTGASYFEYGKDIPLTSRTVARNSTGAFSEFISGLSSNTNYYFRFVSQCSGGLSYGAIEFFRTQGTTTVRPIIVQGTTVIGIESPIMLKIEDRYQSIGVGDTVDYTVTYKNIGKSLLTNPVVQVIVPKGIVITNSSAGTYSNDTNTLTVPLNDLKPGAEGVIYLQGRVDSITSENAQIVTTAILVYTSPNGAQENAIAYVLNSPRDIINTLGASAFWSGIWNMGIIGWLLLIILILLIILVTRRYYSNKSVVRTTSPTGSHTTTTTNY